MISPHAKWAALRREPPTPPRVDEANVVSMIWPGSAPGQRKPRRADVGQQLVGRLLERSASVHIGEIVRDHLEVAATEPRMSLAIAVGHGRAQPVEGALGSGRAVPLREVGLEL